MRLEPLSRDRSVTQPSPTRLVEQPREPRVAQHHEAARRDAVGHVVEPLRPQLGEVVQHGLLQQRRVQRGDAVDGVAADGREVRHAHVLVAGLVDQRHPRDARVVAGIALPHLVEEAAVDLVDDLEVARQQAPEQRQRPGLERLGQQRVVGVGERALRDVPGLVPGSSRSSTSSRISSATAIDGWVSLSWIANLSGKRAIGAPLQVEQAQHVLQRAGDEEVLLLEAQPLAGLGSSFG